MRPSRLTLGAVFLLAFAVRVVWILGFQHPLHAIYSDMAGYVDRAERLLWNVPMSEPRILAIYPWGAHALYAAEFALVGRHGEVPLGLAHAFVGAIPAPCMVLLSSRIVPSRRIAALVGVLVAFWFPQVAFAGFFLSEHWYAAAIALQSVWTTSSVPAGPVPASGRGSARRVGWERLRLLGAGIASAVAFAVRPQFIVTWALDVARSALSFTQRTGMLRAAARVALLVVPMALIVAGSAVRLRSLTGHWGLISENDQMTRIWADTDVCELKSGWTGPDGGRMGYWFSPPSKPVQKPSDVEEFEGFIADPDILKAIRLRRLVGVPWTARVWRKFHNVGLLFTGNLPWPESNYKDPEWRHSLQKGFADAVLYAVLPLAALGCLLARRTSALFIAAVNSVTCIVCAAFFFGEGRYHVPYDPFFLVLAVAGLWELGRRTKRRVIGRLRRTVPATPRP